MASKTLLESARLRTPGTISPPGSIPASTWGAATGSRSPGRQSPRSGGSERHRAPLPDGARHMPHRGAPKTSENIGCPCQAGIDTSSPRWWDQPPRREIGPLVGSPHHVGWAKAPGTVSPSVPVDQPEARLVEGHNLKRLAGAVALLAPRAHLLGKLFLKASCSSVSAFSWRGRPVFSFTFLRLRSPPTLSG